MTASAQTQQQSPVQKSPTRKAGAAPTTSSPGAVQLKQSIAGLGYDAQVAALAPGAGDPPVQGRNMQAGAAKPGAPVQLKTADPAKGISDGKTTLEQFNGGEVGHVAKGKAGLEQSKDNSSTLADMAKSIKTQSARTEKEMLASIAAGGMPRFVARVDAAANFRTYGTFGNPTREFVFATEPADLRGCKPGAALIKVGWVKDWLKGKIGQEIGICILDTTKAVPAKDGSGDKKMAVGKMEWPEIITKAMGDSDFKKAAVVAGCADDKEIGAVLEVLKATPVKATPAYKNPTLALKVRKLLDTHYGANELYTGMGATMNTEGGLGAREVMVMNNGTGLKLTPDNHIIESLGALTQGEYDSMP